MTRFEFNTVTTMKDYNRENYWICSDIVKYFAVEAEDLRSALKAFAEHVQEDSYINVSKTAIRRKRKMYKDAPNGAEEIGYVITGKTEFFDDDRRVWKSQYINLWVEVSAA